MGLSRNTVQNILILKFVKAPLDSLKVPTFAHGPIASVARLTGATVASDHVEAQGVLVTVVEPTEAFVML